jgi:hypothetical protein
VKKILMFCWAMGLGFSAVAETNSVPSTVRGNPPARPPVQKEPAQANTSTNAVPGNDVYFGPAYRPGVLQTTKVVREESVVVGRGSPTAKSTDEQLNSIFRLESDNVTDTRIGPAVQILFPSGH